MRRTTSTPGSPSHLSVSPIPSEKTELMRVAETDQAGRMQVSPGDGGSASVGAGVNGGFGDASGSRVWW